MGFYYSSISSPLTGINCARKSYIEIYLKFYLSFSKKSSCFFIIVCTLRIFHKCNLQHFRKKADPGLLSSGLAHFGHHTPSNTALANFILSSTNRFSSNYSIKGTSRDPPETTCKPGNNRFPHRERGRSGRRRRSISPPPGRKAEWGNG